MPLAEIDRFGGDKDAALRGELEHYRASKKLWTMAAKGSEASGE